MALSSVIRTVKALDSTSTAGAGKTALAFGDITAKYRVDGGVLTSLTTEDITTLGTYQAPTSAAHIRIKKISDSDPCKGELEIHFHNTQLATGTKLWLSLSASGAVIQPLEVDLSNLSGRLPAALTTNGNMKASLVEILTTALTETTGLLAGAFKKFFNVATPTGTVNSLPDIAPPLISGSVSDASPAVTDFDCAAGLSATDDFYKNSVLTFTSGTLAGVARRITAYTGLTRNVSFDSSWPVAPTNGDTFAILGRIDT